MVADMSVEHLHVAFLQNQPVKGDLFLDEARRKHKKHIHQDDLLNH